MNRTPTQTTEASLAEMEPHERRVLSEMELANRWGLSPRTLQRWRIEGIGPQYLKLSKRVGYPLTNIVAYEKSMGFSSTSQRA